MKLLLDQDVYSATVRFLRSAGHDVITAADAGLSRARDVTLMAHARENNRLLVTRDREFGHLALLADLNPGVLYFESLLS